MKAVFCGSLHDILAKGFDAIRKAIPLKINLFPVELQLADFGFGLGRWGRGLGLAQTGQQQ